MLPAPQAPGLMQALNEAGSGPSSADRQCVSGQIPPRPESSSLHNDMEIRPRSPLTEKVTIVISGTHFLHPHPGNLSPPIIDLII